MIFERGVYGCNFCLWLCAAGTSHLVFTLGPDFVQRAGRLCVQLESLIIRSIVV